MLVLSRKVGQSFFIWEDIKVIILGVDRDRVKVGIEAPNFIPIAREEIIIRGTITP